MTIKHDAAHKRFDLYGDDGAHLGEITYQETDAHTLCADHTEVFAGGEGKGYAARLLDALVAYAAARQAIIVPHCRYVAAMFKKYPEKYAAVIRE